MRNILISWVVGLFSVSALGAEIATIFGRPNMEQGFVSSILEKSYSNFPDPTVYEQDASTILYSILARKGVARATNVEVYPAQGFAEQSKVLKAIDTAAIDAPVVLTVARTDRFSDEELCRKMISKTNVAFVMSAGFDPSGVAVDPSTQPSCLGGNILVVASLDPFYGTIAPYSNFGWGARVASPGVNIPVTNAYGQSEYRTGVPLATTIAAGQLAVFARLHPSYTGATLIEKFLDLNTVALPGLQGRIEGARALQ